MARPGFVIDEQFYPLPDMGRLCDCVLVEELTGLSWDAFLTRAEALFKPDAEEVDQVPVVGLVGMAVWQRHPNWRRDRVARFVQDVRHESLRMVADQNGRGDGDARPPAEPAGSTRSEQSASSSGSDSATTSQTSNQPLSGTPISPTSPEEQSG